MPSGRDWFLDYGEGDIAIHRRLTGWERKGPPAWPAREGIRIPRGGHRIWALSFGPVVGSDLRADREPSLGFDTAGPTGTQ